VEHGDAQAVAVAEPVLEGVLRAAAEVAVAAAGCREDAQRPGRACSCGGVVGPPLGAGWRRAGCVDRTRSAASLAEI
jgi:hypothetical protein